MFPKLIHAICCVVLFATYIIRDALAGGPRGWLPQICVYAGELNEKLKNTMIEQYALTFQ